MIFKPFICHRCGYISFDGSPHKCNPKKVQSSFHSKRMTKCLQCEFSFRGFCTIENKKLIDKTTNFYDRCLENFWLPVIIKCDGCSKTVINTDEVLKKCPYCGEKLEEQVKNIHNRKTQSDYQKVDFAKIEENHINNIKDPYYNGIYYTIYDTNKIILDNSIKNNPKKELVVSLYTEKIDWINHIPDNIDLITIYKKGNNIGIEKIKDDRIRIIELNNIGKEAHTWLYHFISRRNSLANTTYLSQGNPLKHSPDFLDLLELDYSKPTPLTKHYDITDSYKAYGSGSPCITKDFFYDVEINDKYKTVFKVLTEKKEAFYKCINHVWKDFFINQIPLPLFVCNGAMWALPKKSICIRSDKFYRSMITSSITANQAEGMWNYIFNEQYETIIK